MKAAKGNRNASSLNGFGESMWMDGPQHTPLQMPPGFWRKRRTKNMNETSRDSTISSGCSKTSEKATCGREGCAIPLLPLDKITKMTRSNLPRPHQLSINQDRTHNSFSPCSATSTRIRRDVCDMVRTETRELKDLLNVQFRQRVKKEKQMRLLEAEVRRLKDARG
mgnify:CR=1 FL=1|jgi:hypothetical protein